jgi:indolepyruvate ferredoxin oxidoreductase, alpha subunit
MHTSICMGASIGMAFGFEKARGKEFASQSVAVIGDSTFWHSGLTGLVDVVYNKGYTTVIILDNSITAMTGHQNNPSTGVRLNGSPAPALDIKKVVEAIGVRRVVEVAAYDLKELERVIKEEISTPEPSVIITKQPCLLIKGINRPGNAFSVDPQKCTGCRACRVIGCPAISFVNKKAVIESSLCVGCGICADICSFSAISENDEGMDA